MTTVALLAWLAATAAPPGSAHNATKLKLERLLLSANSTSLSSKDMPRAWTSSPSPADAGAGTAARALMRADNNNDDDDDDMNNNNAVILRASQLDNYSASTARPIRPEMDPRVELREPNYVAAAPLTCRANGGGSPCCASRNDDKNVVLVAIYSCLTTSDLVAVPHGELMPRLAQDRQNRPPQLAFDSPLCDLLGLCIVATLVLLLCSAAHERGAWRKSGLSCSFMLLLLLQGAAWLLPAAEAARIDNAATIPFNNAGQHNAFASEAAPREVLTEEAHDRGDVKGEPGAALGVRSSDDWTDVDTTWPLMTTPRTSPPSGLLSDDVGNALVVATHGQLHVARRLQTTSVSPGAGTLQAAVDGASSGDALLLADGYYTAGNNTYVLGLIGKDITIQAQNAGQAILDGLSAGRVVHISGGTVTLDGLKITKGNCYAKSNGYTEGNSNGGGLYVSGANTTVTLTYCEIFSNFCNGLAGGGLAIHGGTINFSSCNIHNNQVYGYGMASGGGGDIRGGTVTFQSCQIYSNTALNNGAGISITWGAMPGVSRDGTVTFQSCQIYSNTATGSHGGGVAVDGNGVIAVAFINCNINNNQARRAGGGVSSGASSDAGSLTFTNCNIYNNQATVPSSYAHLIEVSACRLNL